MKKALVIITFMIVSTAIIFLYAQASEEKAQRLIFGVFAEGEEQLQHTLILVESIRTFTGRYQDSPVWIYVPEESLPHISAVKKKFNAFGAIVKGSKAPVAALQFPYARKVFAAAKAESEAEGQANILVWMDDDTVFLNEPDEFDLRRGVAFGYRPVMHQLIGSLYSEPVDEFWTRVYQKLSVPESAIFPMTTPADSKTIRPYFNAGLLVVRPEQGILRKWALNFPLLYEDKVFVDWCKEDRYKLIFLHQVALAGAVLNKVKRDEMTELSFRINYPVFFDRLFEADKDFSSIEEAVTIRYDVFFRKAPPNWDKTLRGPKEKIAWLKERISESKN
jgi:hypothetical protein